MASVGEKTGQLETSLLNVVRFYKRETETFVESLSSIIEPVVIIFGNYGGIFGGVGFVASLSN